LPVKCSRRVALAGVTIFSFNLFHTDTVVLGSSWAPLVPLWVVLMTNAINLIDGLDGLAAGIVAIGGGAVPVRRPPVGGARSPGNIGPLVIIAVGVCLGFSRTTGTRRRS
jgi:UDP-GlcNAc:undecaprenyl-phosphate GlcNAc-1-phosphate transferase